MRILRCGDLALLLDCKSLDGALAWQRAVQAADLADVTDVVPAARTVLVRFRHARAAREAARALDGLQPGADVPSRVPRQWNQVELPVDYSGPDLAEVGRLTGAGADGVVRAHTRQVWRVAFCGFAPGFAYLVGEDNRLQVVRRAEPRRRVPAGAVGLAGEFSGVYPRASPGGWQLIGHTDAVLWDVDRDPPALLAPGTRVRFTAV